MHANTRTVFRVLCRCDRVKQAYNQFTLEKFVGRESEILILFLNFGEIFLHESILSRIFYSFMTQYFCVKNDSLRILKWSNCWLEKLVIVTWKILIFLYTFCSLVELRLYLANFTSPKFLGVSKNLIVSHI